MARFVDKRGNECAYYDTDVTFPVGGVLASDPVPSRDEFGTYMLDMKDPAKPLLTESLRTPAMISPHESLLLNAKRGLLAAVMGQAAFYPGFVDVYDLNEDCRHPTLKSSLPTGILGHESGWSPDGLTFYASSLFGGTLTAVDLTDPASPETLWVGRYYIHGLSISDDGKRAYLAAATTTTARGGLKILDVSQIQDRVPNPSVTVISDLTWPTLSVPQITWPVTIVGHKYVIEMDEFATGGEVGAAPIIDIANKTKPVVVSDIRLEGEPARAPDRAGGRPWRQQQRSRRLHRPLLRYSAPSQPRHPRLHLHPVRAPAVRHP